MGYGSVHKILSSCVLLNLRLFVVALIHQTTPLDKLTNQNLDLQHRTATAKKNTSWLGFIASQDGVWFVSDS